MAELRPRRCLDGKIRMKPLHGYDCTHHHWRSVPYIYSECDVVQDGYYHDCEFSRNPQNCPNFKENVNQITRL